jgi:hypothetical protein
MTKVIVYLHDSLIQTILKMSKNDEFTLSKEIGLLLMLALSQTDEKSFKDVL